MTRELGSYERKRDFEKTPEPSGRSRRVRAEEEEEKKKNPRFVIHQHSARRLHWDLRLEHDGARACSTPGELRVESRNLNEITDSYPELARIGRDLGSHQAVLDGEIVAFGEDSRPSFGALQSRMHIASREVARRLAKTTPVTYVIFDLLWLDGHTLMALPYADRRARLAELALNGASWQTPEHIIGHGAELLQASVEQRLEGIVAKGLESPYQPGRRAAGWVKIKTVNPQGLIVGGWLRGTRRRTQPIAARRAGVSGPDGAP